MKPWMRAIAFGCHLVGSVSSALLLWVNSWAGTRDLTNDPAIFLVAILSLVFFAAGLAALSVTLAVLADSIFVENRGWRAGLLGDWPLVLLGLLAAISLFGTKLGVPALVVTYSVLAMLFSVPAVVRERSRIAGSGRGFLRGLRGAAREGSRIVDDSGELPAKDAGDSLRYKLYSPAVIALVSLFGVLLGGILMALNYHRLRKRFAAWITFCASLIAQILLLALLLKVFPGADNPMPGLACCLLSPLVMYPVARSLQGPIIRAHRAAGGKLAY